MLLYYKGIYIPFKREPNCKKKILLDHFHYVKSDVLTFFNSEFPLQFKNSSNVDFLQIRCSLPYLLIYTDVKNLERSRSAQLKLISSLM